MITTNERFDYNLQVVCKKEIVNELTRMVYDLAVNEKFTINKIEASQPKELNSLFFVANLSNESNEVRFVGKFVNTGFKIVLEIKYLNESFVDRMETIRKGIADDLDTFNRYWNRKIREERRNTKRPEPSRHGARKAATPVLETVERKDDKSTILNKAQEVVDRLEAQHNLNCL